MRCFVHFSNPLRFEEVSSAIRGSTIDGLRCEADIDVHSVSLSHMQEYLPQLTPELLAQHPDEHIIFFMTHSARFSISYQTTARVNFTDYWSSTWPIIKDSTDTGVGNMCRMSFESVGAGDSSDVELIEVGRKQDPNIPEEILPPMVIVLHINRDSSGLATRVNIGEVELKAWEAADPSPCLVALI